MTGSLGRRSSAFEGVGFRNALKLLDVLERSTLLTESRIRTVFSQYSEGFDATLAFLVGVGLVQEDAGTLSLRVPAAPVSGPLRQDGLLLRILQMRNRYRSEILKYLGKYELRDGELSHSTTVHRRSGESHVRNFLMEMGVVQHIAGTGRCILSPEYVWLWANAIGRGRQVRPDLLARAAAARDAIGLSAEIAIVESEKRRLGPELEGGVDHVALRNAAAGYDIQSFSISENERISRRYIEVKAVPPSSMRFHWTQNEVKVAQVLQDAYYLYLVPVCPGGSLDLDRLMTICNPAASVLQSGTEWIVESDVLRCSLRKQDRDLCQIPGGLNNA